MTPNGYDPCIFIPGIGRSVLCDMSDDGSAGTKVWPPELDSEKLLNDLKPSLMKMMLFRTDAGFSDAVRNMVKDAVGPVFASEHRSAKQISASFAGCSENEKKYIAKNTFAEKLSEVIGGEKIFYFSYDFVGDQFGVAHKLDDFIQNVRTECNCDKVSLVPIGLGGAVALSYLSLFADKNTVSRILFTASSALGTSLLSGMIKNTDGFANVTELLSGIVPGQSSEQLDMMLKMIPEKVMAKTLEGIKDDLVRYIYTSPLLLSLIPVRDRDIVGDKIKDRKTADSAERYFSLQQNCREVIGKAAANGIKVSALVGCGVTFPEIIPDCNADSDGMVDASLASFGAECIGGEPDKNAADAPLDIIFLAGCRHGGIIKNTDAVTKAADILTA